MNIVETQSGTRVYRVTFVPKSHVIVEFIRDGNFVSMKKFEVGDNAIYDSFQLDYVGRIKSIGVKTVTISSGWTSCSSRRLGPYEFASRNWDFDLERITKKNAEVSMHI